jgi:hypothetical protein
MSSTQRANFSKFCCLPCASGAAGRTGLSSPADPSDGGRRTWTGALDDCRTEYCLAPGRRRRTREAHGGCPHWTPLESPRTREPLGIRSCSRVGSFDQVAERSRLRSILLRLQSRSPSHETRSAFPADCPHRPDCHCPYQNGRASTGRILGVSSI